jgi:hypothetical protein
MSVLTKLSDKAYWSMRKAMVKEACKSEDMSIACVAKRHKISPSTLWQWCKMDLGPNQMKWLLEKSNKIRGKRKTANNEARIANFPAPVPDPAAKHILAVKTLNKPWDKKKARIAAEQAIAIPACLAALEVDKVLHKFIPTVTIQLDAQGKFIKYEVHGEVNVRVSALVK